MKNLILTLFAALICVAAYAQPLPVIHQMSEENVQQPYLWACEEGYLDWSDYEYAGDFDCPAASEYYVDYIHVPPGNILNSIVINLSELNIRDENGNLRGTYNSSIIYPQGAEEECPFNHLDWLLGLEIYDINSSYSEHKISRNELTSMCNEDDLVIVVDNLSLHTSDYEIRLIRNEGSNLGASGYNSSNQFCIDINVEEYGQFTMVMLNEAIFWPNFAIGQTIENPEITVSSIEYHFQFTTIEWEHEGQDVCEFDEFSIAVPHNPELYYDWSILVAGNYVNQTISGVGQSELVATLDSLNRTYKLSIRTGESPDSTIVFQNDFINIFAQKNPEWGYESVEYNIPEGASCLKMYEVSLDSLNLDFEDGATCQWKVWSGDDYFCNLEGFNCGGLTFFENGLPVISDSITTTGLSIFFCGSDLYLGGDTVTAFEVEVVSPYGCTRKDTAYFVCNPNDTTFSIKSFIITDTSITSAQDRQLTASGFKMYPNPARDLLNIEQPFQKDYNVTIFAASGMVVEQHHFNVKSVQIDVSNLARGFYIVVIDDGVERLSSKLAKH